LTAQVSADLFGDDFDGLWESSDGTPVEIGETDGVFTVNGPNYQAGGAFVGQKAGIPPGH
jgi:hypothetical protein